MLFARTGNSYGLRCQLRWWHPGLEPPRELLGGKRPADEISLRLVAAHLLEQVKGGRVFDAFGDDPLPELVGKLDTRLHDGAIPVAGAHFQYERAVDLDFVDWQAAEISQGGIAGAEVVDGKLKSHRAEPLEDVLRPLGLGHHDRLGELERNPGGRDKPSLERRPELDRKVVVIKD